MQRNMLRMTACIIGNSRDLNVIPYISIVTFNYYYMKANVCKKKFNFLAPFFIFALLISPHLIFWFLQSTFFVFVPMFNKARKEWTNHTVSFTDVMFPESSLPPVTWRQCRSAPRTSFASTTAGWKCEIGDNILLLLSTDWIPARPHEPAWDCESVSPQQVNPKLTELAG